MPIARRSLCVLAPLIALTTMSSSFAQTLPPTSRTVFKCEVGSKVVYSDSPCPGAKRIELEPTRGFSDGARADKFGTDVWRERHNERMAEALKPVFGENPKQRATRLRRAKLEAAAQLECTKLDRDLPAAEQQERTAPSAADLSSTRTRLFDLRRRFRELRC